MNSRNMPVKRILVAPLDWGLGHATRCIPLIRKMVEKGHQVFLAGEGAVQTLLQTEFPQIPFLHLPGYRICYGASALQTTLKLLRQLPKITKAVKQEHIWLQNAMQQHHFDAVISDNRYGLYHPKAYSVFITHQLRIKTSVATAEWAAQKWMYKAIENFDACWVPDVAGKPSLAGDLSHPQKVPEIPVRYIGPLSRCEAINSFSEKPYLLFLLSGPEPQRTIFENILLSQIKNTAQNIVLVRGLPGSDSVLDLPPHVQVFNHLPAAELAKKAAEAFLVICRSGYSTIMDLAAMQKKSVLVPTPGQTEQQYLARHLQQQGFAPWRRQKDFDLKDALQAAEAFHYGFAAINSTGLLNAALDNLEAAL